MSQKLHTKLLHGFNHARKTMRRIAVRARTSRAEDSGSAVCARTVRYGSANIHTTEPLPPPIAQQQHVHENRRIIRTGAPEEPAVRGFLPHSPSHIYSRVEQSLSSPPLATLLLMYVLGSSPHPFVRRSRQKDRRVHGQPDIPTRPCLRELRYVRENMPTINRTRTVQTL